MTLHVSTHPADQPIQDHYPSAQIREGLSNPYLLSPSHIKPYTPTTIYPRHPEPNTYIKPLTSKIFGIWSYPRLGNLTTSITAKPNEAIVLRSAGLSPLFYGFNFTYEEYMAVSSPIVGVLIHFALIFMTLLISFTPTRAILKALAPFKPGFGPDHTKAKKDVLEMRAIAVAEQLSKIPRKAYVNLRYEGSMYQLTAVFLAEAAMVLLDPKEVESVKGKHGSGFLTPSCLGDAFVERAGKQGVKIDVRQIGDTGSK